MGGFRVELRGVTKRFETGARTITALDSVSFALEPGTVLAVTGPSGSGKSTLLHVLGAMDEADAGSIAVGDFAVDELDGRGQVAYRRRIGFVFQRFHLLPALAGLEIVQLLLDLRAQRAMTVIVVTHNPLVAARCDRVARLHDGRLLDDVEVPRRVPPDEMLARISRIEP